MTPLRQLLRRLLSDTGCAAPVTADGGVLRCVRTAGPSGVCDDHLAWRSFRIPMRILFGFKPWWPNELGSEMDRAGRARARRGEPLVADGLVHGKLLDDTPCCPAGWAGAFTTVFLKVVTCPDCRHVMQMADATDRAYRAAGAAAGQILFQPGDA